MATINCTVVAAHVETHPTDGSEILYIAIRGATGETEVAVAGGARPDRMTARNVPSVLGQTVAVTVDDGTGEVTVIDWSP